jgi:hypothetical protein
MPTDDFLKKFHSVLFVFFPFSDLKIVVCPVVPFLLASALSVLLRLAAFNYLFAIINVA